MWGRLCAFRESVCGALVPLCCVALLVVVSDALCVGEVGWGNSKDNSMVCLWVGGREAPPGFKDDGSRWAYLCVHGILV